MSGRDGRDVIAMDPNVEQGEVLSGLVGVRKLLCTRCHNWFEYSYRVGKDPEATFACPRCWEQIHAQARGMLEARAGNLPVGASRVKGGAPARTGHVVRKSVVPRTKPDIIGG